jgi:hypothetical protein
MWFLLYAVAGSLICRSELLAVPIMTHFLTGIWFEPTGDSPLSAGLYHIRFLAGLLFQSIPAIVVQSLNNRGLQKYGIPNAWSPLNIASLVFSALTSLVSLYHAGRQFQRHGFRFEEWRLPKFKGSIVAVEGGVRMSNLATTVAT